MINTVLLAGMLYFFSVSSFIVLYEFFERSVCGAITKKPTHLKLAIAGLLRLYVETAKCG